MNLFLVVVQCFSISRGMRFNTYLSDTNRELITTYRAVKDNVKEVIRRLETYQTEYKKYPPYSKEQQEYYFQLRNAKNNIKSGSEVEIVHYLLRLTRPALTDSIE